MAQSSREGVAGSRSPEPRQQLFPLIANPVFYWAGALPAAAYLEHRRMMKRSFRVGLVLGIVGVLVVIAAAVGWRQGLFQPFGIHRPANALMVIEPYAYAGTWVFDDAAAGLKREPFVAGVPEMINLLVKDIPGATNGFRMLFSTQPFPGHQKRLSWVRPEGGGNYYRMGDPPMEGWLCPALFRYYREAPKELYVKAEPKT